MGKEGLETDVGGHVQACSQGGTCDRFNLFPQDRNFNVSAYRTFYENVIGRALKNPDQTVGPTTVKFIRGDGSQVRPDKLEVTYTIDGVKSTQPFVNAPREFTQ